MKKKAGVIFITLLFLAGLSLLLYPFVANQWNNYRQRQLISSYDHTVSDLEAAGGVDYDGEWERAHAYNRALLPSILPDSFAVAEASGRGEEYMSCLNIVGNGVMGTVEIPKIDITLPVFHTTEEELLQMAAGHLEGSSLPVGGEDTHAVISAHRGLPSAALFTDLDKMEEGDHFLLHVLDDTLCYEVDQITVIEPEDTGALAVEKGKDLVTLLTCTPYGINSERLLVRGHRVPYVPEEVAEEKVPFGNMSLHTNYLLWVVVGLLITGLFSLLLYGRERRRRRKEKAGKQGAPEENPERENSPENKTPSEPDETPESEEVPESEERP
ncbi:MAG: class C sortase [Lachnospiraceae bacterium]|nr:class C sortase [Lachnospiraceae bacterium]